MKKNRTGYKHEASRFRATAYLSSLILLACVSTGVVAWVLYNDILRNDVISLYDGDSSERVTFSLKNSDTPRSLIESPSASRKRNLVSKAFEREKDVYGVVGVSSQFDAAKEIVRRPFAVKGNVDDELGGIRESGGFVKLPEARPEMLFASGKQRTESESNPVQRRRAGAGNVFAAPVVPDRPMTARPAPPVRVEVARRELNQPREAAPVQEWDRGMLAENGGDGMFTLGFSDGYAEQVPPLEPAEIEPLRKTRTSRKVQTVASDSAYANPYGKPLDPDDLFSLKLHAVYGTSKADFEDERLGRFNDRFLVLGGKKKIDFAGMDQMDIAFDGVITTSGTWDSDTMRQNLSGFTLNVGPEFKLPELPLKFETNLGVGWLKRDATIFDDYGDLARADIDSFVYGGGLALRGDWQWRMVKMSGMAGVQYAAANEKSHQFRLHDGTEFDDKVPKTTYSAWEVPLQLHAGAEYRLLDALTVSPALWGGYTYNITGKEGPFHSGHLAGAGTNWRRNGVTWNKSHWNFGGEVRLNIADRINLWFDYQKEWAGGDSGSYYGGGLQIAF